MENKTPIETEAAIALVQDSIDRTKKALVAGESIITDARKQRIILKAKLRELEILKSQTLLQ